MQVTIITPTIGRPSLQRLIESIDKQTASGMTMHLLLWDQQRDSNAHTPESYNSERRQSIVLPAGTGRNGHAPGSPLRAIGLMCARTPWVTFADDDVSWQAEHLVHLRQAMAAKHWASTLGTVWSPTGERLGVDRFDSVGDLSFLFAYHGEVDRDLQIQAATAYAKALPALHYIAAHCAVDARRGSTTSAARVRVGFISRFLYTA